ncbi:uncharacterized protein LOC132038047 [Lycium ferocissimum]|uniref:uncharacterized protein LOC132038047 n=1 Tax=Lycium ferocissimum TaxID=112874 RepID=UPI0028159085|nr:uncharacterized protein LOC132038047 [Lycium ferocissimum]
MGVCYSCGQPGHVMGNCPSRDRGGPAQPVGSIAGSSSSVRPPGQGSSSVLAGRGRGRGQMSGSGSSQNRIYALTGRQDLESSPDVVTGHIVSDEGIKVDDRKIEAVKNWPRPTTASKIRSFLGLAGYYRRFVEGFSSIAAPLTKLTQKGAKFQWSEACERSFQKLKDKLTSAPVLTLPEGTEGYTVYCDASRTGLGCVLMQNGKDYDAEILYHPGKANVVADALSRKSMGSLLYVPAEKLEMTRELYRLANLGVRLLDSEDTGITLQNISQSTLASDVKVQKYEDPVIISTKEGVQQNRISAFELDSNGVKIEHQKPSGLLQEMEIPMWKWEVINMDFIMGLPRSHRKFDSIWVIIDRLTKSARFLPVRTTYVAEDYAKLYLKEIVRLHGIPVSIISDRGAQFTAKFWKSFQESLGTRVRRLRTKDVASVKVLWRSKDREEMTWEAEAEMKSKYPHLFPATDDAIPEETLQESAPSINNLQGKSYI